jgi:sugar phosphate isomerase/epimerase
MKNNRRTFMRAAGAVTAGAILFPQMACKTASAGGSIANTAPVITGNMPMKGSLDKFGIQLYTLRDVIGADPQGTIAQVARMGYKQIEGFEGRQGMFWDMGYKDFKMFLDDNGLEMVSSHCNIRENFEEKAAQAAAVGMSYLICPYIGPQKSVEDWKQVTDLFNECGEICRKNGLRFAYHNHAYSFKPFSGMIPQDFMMENTDPAIVDHEMDIYWVVTGGADPITYLDKYPNRFRLCHVKDRMKNAGDEQSATCDLGTGIIDFPHILKVAKEKGMKYFILEQERYDNSTPMKSAEIGANYLKNLKFA